MVRKGSISRRRRGTTWAAPEQVSRRFVGPVCCRRVFSVLVRRAGRWAVSILLHPISEFRVPRARNASHSPRLQDTHKSTSTPSTLESPHDESGIRVTLRQLTGPSIDLRQRSRKRRCGERNVYFRPRRVRKRLRRACLRGCKHRFVQVEQLCTSDVSCSTVCVVRAQTILRGPGNSVGGAYSSGELVCSGSQLCFPRAQKPLDGPHTTRSQDAHDPTNSPGTP